MKRVSDARSQRLDEFRQGREKQEVLLQLHNQQVKAEAEAEAQAAAAAASGGAAGVDDSEEKRAPRVQAEEDRNLVVIIKADVQVCVLLDTDCCCAFHAALYPWNLVQPHSLYVASAVHVVSGVCKKCTCPGNSCRESCVPPYACKLCYFARG